MALPAAQAVTIAFQRFGLGPKPGGRDAVTDARAALHEEIARGDAAMIDADTAEQFGLEGTTGNYRRVYAAAAARKAMQAIEADAAMARRSATAAEAAQARAAALKEVGGAAERIYRAEALARIRRAIEARAGFVERLVAFWSNHFCVSAAKGPVGRVTAGAFEREAIRPHVLGRFADMLVAAESHPAMLHFLDNARSVGPVSRAGLRSGRGLNENLGREIMELHTLGVDGGYTQADVTNLARILTGWSIEGPEGQPPGDARGFVFRAGAHEPGPIPLLGRTYADAGAAQGRAALDDLARRPQTARFVATKLARAFVADAPPPALVDGLARTFRDTDGDLRAVSLALISAPEAWAPTPGKVRTPWELIIATNRLLGHLPEDPGQVLGPLRTLGMPLWEPPGPNGFPAADAAWASPEGIKLRLDYCALVASKLKTPPNPSELLAALCGGAQSPETRQAVARAESREQGLALLLMSPEMQRS
ncbi:MAG: DUF1800 family protein [Caulobacteraceae bacterium]|nr:DUF1800 family protein [Caulobacter sp.]